MEFSNSATPRRRARGFTLPTVLVVVTALLVLAVGVILLVSIERNTARSFSDRQRAELAVRAGVEDLRAVLTTETASDKYMVVQSTLANAITTNTQQAPHLFLVTPSTTGGAYKYRYTPLFSTKKFPADSSTLTAPSIEPAAGLVGDTKGINYTEFTTLPYNDSVRASWVYLQEDGTKQRIVSRYAFWVEDLQGRVDPEAAGNEKGGAGVHARAKYPFPAPGLPDDPDSKLQPVQQAALYAVEPTATQDAQGSIGKTLLKNRPIMVTPDSVLAGAGLVPPQDRLKAPDATGKIGELTSEASRSVEESLVSNIQPYREQALVPYAEGIDPSVAGQDKLNLNKLLATGGGGAVTQMADFITKGLPKFTNRKGGFPDDYNKTLAANAIDYADTDGDSTTDGSTYRGIDSFPLVSEFMLKGRWENARDLPSGAHEAVISVTIYAELWNMTNKPVTGSAQLSYETKGKFQMPPDPNFYTLDDLSKAVGHNLTQIDGEWYFPAQTVALNPNEYRLIKWGTVTYTFQSSNFIASPMTISGELYGATKRGYKLRWNNKLVDQARGAIHRNDYSISYPTDTKASSRQRFRASVPGHSYTRNGTFVNNMGDPRMCYYIAAPQDANVYPQNISPNRRNIRYGSIYSGNVNTIYGRVLPSEWPDGGHDSPWGADTMYGLKGMTSSTFDDEHRIDPDDPVFFTQLPYDYSTTTGMELAIKEAPTRVSNLGRFYSATELGRVYDPVMWQIRASTATDNPAGLAWGDVTAAKTSSTDFGGGNTLRIGRPEHGMFNKTGDPGQEAYHLLDLFHAGDSRSDDKAMREGNQTSLAGNLNINTASKGALRTLIAGQLTQDPEIRKFTANSHTAGKMKYPTYSAVSPAPDPMEIASRIADGVIRNRPYATPSAMSEAVEANGTPLFGNPKLWSAYSGTTYPILQCTDSALEETFARVYEAATVRSRNFRIWVVGQTLTPVAVKSGTGSGTEPPVPASTPEVLAEVRKAYTVFVDPGTRKSDGTIDPAKLSVKILHESDF